MHYEDLVTPADVEREMAVLADRLEKAPQIIKEYHNKLRAARLDYKKSYALAYATSTGTVMDRKMAAEIECEPKQQALDEAEIEYRFVVDTMDALKAKLRALQSVGSMIRSQMFQAGN